MSAALPVAPRSEFRTRLRDLLTAPLARVVARRLLTTVPLLFVVSALSFLLISLTPGDAARQILGTDAPPEAYPKLRHQLGLDLPIHQQYWNWLRHALGGDLGSSLYTGQSVTDAINGRLPVTISLITGALLVSVLVGVGLGVLSAVRRGTLGRFIDGFAMIGAAIPPFWAGAVLIVIVAVKLAWLPPTGYVPAAESPSLWAASLVLPVLALSLAGIAALAKQTREAMLDVLGSEHIRMARANGIARKSLVFRHGLKNAAIRVTTIVGIQAVGLLGGTVVTESVFALPGLGSLAVNSTVQHDLPVVQGLVLYFTVIVVAINLVIDLTYSWLNPKVRTR
ncbi:ABC transporter permease [Amycolatopsis sacchari]|uniref:ABC transporter permease n=1 Tax=Amycolatopsis sacchari TaxID=115433 RepID=UPI003EB906D3